MVEVQTVAEEGCIYLHDRAERTEIVWSCDSGLIQQYTEAGNVLLRGGKDEMPLQFYVECGDVPVVRARRFADNPFLPTALLHSLQSGTDWARIGFVYRTVVPLLPGAPAVTVHTEYAYERSQGVTCRLWVAVHEPAAIRASDLMLRLVVRPGDQAVLRCGPESDVGERCWHEEGQTTRIFTRRVGSPTAYMVLHIAPRGKSTGFSPPREEGEGHAVPTCPPISAEITSTTLRTFSDLLLTCFDARGRMIAGFNIVEQQGPHYYGADRDDVVAEMVAISCRYYRRFGHPAYLDRACKLARELLLNVQEDGGLTYALNVNGANVDYSDTDADAIEALLLLYELTGDEDYLHRAKGICRFMLQMQDKSGFFWGRLEREPWRLLFPLQPWFTAYAAVAMQRMVPYCQGAGLEERIAAAEDWLRREQLPDGSWPYDTVGSYADYDDLTNTAVAVWGLAALDRLRGSVDNLDHVEQGLAYLAALEQVKWPGAYTGRFTPGVEVLIYDYKLGFAFREGVSLYRRVHGARAEKTRRLVRRYGRYLRHIAAIQGKAGMIRGGWGSVFDLTCQSYLTSYKWYERASSWHHYVFLGWQGKLIELFLEPFL